MDGAGVQGVRDHLEGHQRHKAREGHKLDHGAGKWKMRELYTFTTHLRAEF